VRHFGHVNNATLLTSVVIALLAVHLVEVASWAAFYLWIGSFSDFNTSLYFSIITYTTLGYGDVVLSNRGWRLLAGVEALTGSLMVCWSTVILIRVVTKVYRQHLDLWQDEESVAPGRMHRRGPRQ
jgi:voltage-gated potassium channel